MIRLSIAAATAAGAQLIGASDVLSVALAYQPRADSLLSDGQVLSQSQLAILHDICAKMIPRTETPSAAELDVHGFVDNQLRHCHPAEDQQAAIAVVEKLDECAVAQHAQPFVGCAAQQQLNLLQNLEAGQNGFEPDDRNRFKRLKQLIVFGYYTTEVGATEELRFDPYPGGFRGSVPFSEIGRAWFAHG